MRVTVTTTPTRLDNEKDVSSEIIAIRDASADIYIGHSDVTFGASDETDGWPYLTTDDPMTFRALASGLWAVTAAGTATVEVLSY